MITLKQIRQLSPQNGDIFALPEGTPSEAVRRFVAHLARIHPHIRCAVVIGDLRKLEVSEMNALGWYRA
ncbi:hypothetical protein [Metapseudomonas furukawaii]|uniref:Uncharacterized protein n=1 Tax=Metapseudomonas furukawaii TaxID=1149133 RepID=A0AAD1BZY7_METFU|nr:MULTISPECIES: hypothetical protein [Pseudomonas]ELS26649.1 hypothetical protein ppKF707_3067 [Pseudomonas furukawaii]OWJ92737.1 hypothetical protein B6S59_19430 [Pseudomonas sp. A46]BAU74393.1 hypothetical protein KF707C_27050 [Pseudomonas furukawaii]